MEKNIRIKFSNQFVYCVFCLCFGKFITLKTEVKGSGERLTILPFLTTIYMLAFKDRPNRKFHIFLPPVMNSFSAAGTLLPFV